MKVMLVLPPAEHLYGKFKKVAPTRPPLGLAYIAAVLEKAGNEVRIFDGGIYDGNELDKNIREFKPNIVGISITTLTFTESLECARLIKGIDKNIFIVAGGPHISISPNESIKYDEFDIGIIGEGEYAMLDMIHLAQGKIKKNEIKGVIYKENGIIARTADRPYLKSLDELPFPARHLLPDLKLYKQTPFKNSRLPQTSMITSRGCPYNCTFCSEYPFKRIYRTHSSDYVIKEIKHLIEKYGIKEVAFQDDVFTLDKKRVHEICDRIINEKIDITWSCWARVNIVDEELLTKMKKAGCIAISYGIEASDDEELKYVNKGVTMEQIKNAIVLTSRVGIYNVGHFVIGYPNDTKEKILNRAKFAMSLPLDAATFSCLIPFPGSKIYEEAENCYGEYDKDYIYGGRKHGSHTTPIYSPPGLTVKDMEELQKQIYKKFYIRPSYILRRMGKLKSFYEFKTLFKAGLNFMMQK